MAALYSGGVELVLAAHLVLLHDGIEDNLVGISHAAVRVHQLVDNVLGHHGLRGQLAGDNIFHATDRLASHAHVDMSYLGLERGFQLLDDIRQALNRPVKIVDDPLADAGRRVLLRHGQDAHTAVLIFLASHAGNPRRAQFDSYYKFLCHT